MSGHTDDIMVHHGVLRKEAGFIQKPFSPDVLAMKVREILMAPDRPARIVCGRRRSRSAQFSEAGVGRRRLRSAGSASGKLALQEARAGRVDLVITDLVMPEQEGIETIRALCREVPGVGIIAISGALGPQFLESGSHVGSPGGAEQAAERGTAAGKVAEVLKSRR